ncbi:MAG: hypothetical protein R3F60_05325 [bacterium]
MTPPIEELPRFAAGGPAGRAARPGQADAVLEASREAGWRRRRPPGRPAGRGADPFEATHSTHPLTEAGILAATRASSPA